MNNWNKVTGWSRHQHFGLRYEWLEHVLQNPKGWEQSTTLGIRQVESLKVWLRTGGIKIIQVA